MKLLFFQESPMYEALAVHFIAGAIEAAGHSCDVVIESHERDVYRTIAELRPDMIAFSIMTRQQEWAIVKIKELKEVFELPILIGGTHPTMYPETLGHCEADYLCVGEGEIPTVELLDRLEEGGRTDNIPNIHAKSGGRIVKNEIRPLMTDWDSMPLPDRTVYGRYPFLGRLPLKRFITSFGCAYKCSFCYINNFREIYSGKGKFYRRKSIERAIQEIEETRRHYPLTRIHFVDDIFSLDRKWVEKFLPAFKKGIHVPFTANIWIAHMDESMVQLFKENGCAGLTFGVESGNEETRVNLIDKNLPDETYLRNCGYLKRYKIPFHTGNIIGLPGEGIEKAYETARFNRTIGVSSTRSGLFWPFPGTRLTDYAIEHGMLESGYTTAYINSAEYINQGIYPTVKHKESDQLVVMASMFQAISKWRWFEAVSRIMLRRPKNPFVKMVARLVDMLFWYSEAKFFGVLNWGGFQYYLQLRKSLVNMRSHKERRRIQEDMEGQRSLWNVSRKDITRVYQPAAAARDGVT